MTNYARGGSPDRTKGEQRSSSIWTAACVTVSILTISCAPSDRDGDTFRYRMTIEISTPRGVATGYATRELTYHLNDPGPLAIGESRSEISMQGEAVVVPLPDGQRVFALLTSSKGDPDYAPRLADRAMVNPKTGLGWDTTSRLTTLYPTVSEGARKVRGDPLPEMVFFHDLKNPGSVQLLDPYALDKSLGRGVSLKRVFIQPTSEQVTWNVVTILPWITDYWDKNLNGGNPHIHDGRFTVKAGDFITKNYR